MGSRRGTGEGSIYRRERDGKWCAVVDLGYVDGKPVRRTRTAATREEAARRLRELTHEIEGGATDVDRRTSVARWCRRWITDDVEYGVSVGRLRPSTAESYERLVRCHIVPPLGHVKLVDLTPRTINRAYAAMLEGGLAASSVIKGHQVLRSRRQRGHRRPGAVGGHGLLRAAPR